MSEPIERLAGGNVAGEVLKIGSVVHKPATAATPAVAALLRHLEHVGCVAAPRWLGLDDEGRQMIEYVDGPLADTRPIMDQAGLRRLGSIIRDLHDALALFRPPPDARWDVVIPPDREDLICHHDLAPWNLVLGEDRWVFIDWDGAGPASRLWDLGYAAHGFVPLHAGGDPAVDGPRLQALAEGYGLDPDQRAALVRAAAGHTRGMYDLLVRGARDAVQPWARLYAEGHAEHWGPAATYIEQNADLLAGPFPD
ncbi:phosphotransferase [Microlunatus ginsengisoli]|uniref:Phosphotransferase n=1 Tax=Microlunatus ginsengisoli TaxID=363863 RepID=A0ABP7APN9_9ACTN